MRARALTKATFWASLLTAPVKLFELGTDAAHVPSAVQPDAAGAADDHAAKTGAAPLGDTPVSGLASGRTSAEARVEARRHSLALRKRSSDQQRRQ
ncbi:MAG: hypothetical protein AAF354_14090 [Pseudomonadota bacterium]